MSKLQQLIDELCHDGVEFKELGDVLDYIQPQKYIVQSTEYSEEFTTPVLTAGQSFMLGYTDETEGIYIASKEKPVIIFDDFTTSNHWVDFDFKVKSSALKILVGKNQENINFRYIFYCIQNINFDKGEHGRKWISKYSKIKVPTPHIEIQNEIVRILDTFTELTAELTAELEARKKQYEYYFDKVLGVDKEREMQSFGNVAKIVRGASPRPISSYITDDPNGINWIKIGDVEQGTKYVESSKQKITVEGSKKSRFVKEGDFIISNSMSFGRPYILATSGCVHDGWLVISDYEETYSSDFLYYVLTSSYVQKYFEMNASNGTVKNLNAEIVKNLMLPIYTKQEQENIVNVLSSFDNIIIDVTQGLPAEIEVRDKQYDYYMHKLLEFNGLKEGDYCDKEDKVQ